MKFVNSVQGSVALHVAADEVVPLRGVVHQDLIRILGDVYSFTMRPEIPRNIPPNLLLPFVFQAGSITFEDSKFPIYQLAILQQGEIVTGPNTEIAERILLDYINRLNSELGYRFNKLKNKRITYQSHIVVDFDVEIGTLVAALGKIKSLLNKEIKKSWCAIPSQKTFLWLRTASATWHNNIGSI